jgi:uncharacterized protein (TIGR02284 family)
MNASAIDTETVLNPRVDSNERRVEHLLDELIRVCRDGEGGFHAAAEHENSALLKAGFLRRSHQRAGFASALRTLLRRHGVASPADSGSLTGALHRKWMEWRDAFKPATGEVLLEEMVRGEKTALQTYRGILEDFPAGLYPEDAAILAYQAREIERSLDELESLASASVR